MEMIKYQEFLKNLLNEQTKSPKTAFVKWTMDMLQKEKKWSDEEINRTIESILSEGLSHHFLRNEPLDQYFYQFCLSRLITENQEDHTQTMYQFYVYWVDQEEKMNRRFLLPAMATMADVGYTILSTFDTMAYHLFSIEYEDYIYDCEVNFEDHYDFPDAMKHVLASRTPLSSIQLKEKDEMIMTYDYGDYWQFVIRLEKVIIEEKKIKYILPNILSGAGHGIFEDNRNLLNDYFDKKRETMVLDGVTTYKKDRLYSVDYYDFNLEKNQRKVKKNYRRIKNSYENPNYQ